MTHKIFLNLQKWKACKDRKHGVGEGKTVQNLKSTISPMISNLKENFRHTHKNTRILFMVPRRQPQNDSGLAWGIVPNPALTTILSSARLLGLFRGGWGSWPKSSWAGPASVQLSHVGTIHSSLSSKGNSQPLSLLFLSPTLESQFPASILFLWIATQSLHGEWETTVS